MLTEVLNAFNGAGEAVLFKAHNSWVFMFRLIVRGLIVRLRIVLFLAQDFRGGCEDRMLRRMCEFMKYGTNPRSRNESLIWNYFTSHILLICVWPLPGSLVEETYYLTSCSCCVCLCCFLLHIILNLQSSSSPSGLRNKSSSTGSVYNYRFLFNLPIVHHLPLLFHMRP
jgi:hypothetical protein